MKVVDLTEAHGGGFYFEVGGVSIGIKVSA
jgi:hypothetical protein